MQTATVGKTIGIAQLKPKLCLLHGQVLTQTVRVMKITGILLLATCLHVCGKGHSQTVTLSEKDAPLEKIFRAIEQQTDFVFFADFALLQKAKAVTINVKGMPLQEALDICFKEQPLSYSIVGKNIVVDLRGGEMKEKAGAIQGLALIDVRGRVTNEENDPVAGVSVLVKGTKMGTSTNGDGEFVLNNVPDDAILVLTAVNIQTVEEAINGRRNLELKVKGKTGKLDEVQVIAYGKTSQRFNVGNVTTVKAEDIEKQPVQNPLLALQGRVPGLVVTQTTGIPGGGVTVRIQGQNSIRSGNDPLYVIDGVPYPSQLLAPDGPLVNGSPLNYINPSDIESIDVLKDADATAIYGSRAANGAILITTKKGKVGRTKVDLNFQQGWGKVTRKVDMLNTRQYLDMRYEAYRNDGIDWRDPAVSADDLKVWDTTRYTDGQKELIGGTAKYTNVNVAVSGGTAAIQFIVGGTYNRQTTVFPGDFDDKRGALHFTLNGSSNNQKFHFQLSGNYIFDDNHLPNTDLTRVAINLEPVAPPFYNPDGTLNWALNASGASTWENPLVYTLYQDYSNITKNLVSNALVSYDILPGLAVKSSFGYTNLQTNTYLPVPLESFRPEDRRFIQRQALYHYRTMNSWIIEPQITYNEIFWMGKFEALIGTSIQQNNNDALDLRGTGYTSNVVLSDIRSAAVVQVSSTNVSEYRYNALFGRLGYTWANKYIINLNARRDGSSRFGGNNKFHNFGSIGLGWLFSQEKLIKEAVPFLSFGKLRASYGTTGNDQIPDYSYLSLYGSIFNVGIPYQSNNGLSAFRIPNPNLQWEQTRKWQIGIDLGFLNDRILINATYARNRSSNQLLQLSLPAVTGFEGITENFPALIQNTSCEFSVNTINIKGRVINWSSNFNLTIPRNKVVSFPNFEESSYAAGFGGVIVGQPLGIQKGYRYLGVDPATGRYLIADKNGAPTTSPIFPDDYLTLINTLPKYYGGFQNNVTYKSFQLDFLFQFVKQIGAKALFYNNSNLPGEFYSTSSNQPVTVLNRWQKPGDNTSIGRYNTDYTVNPYLVSGSDAGYSYAASYIRLKNVSFSWQFPAQWLQKANLQNGRIYFQGQNLVTITNYTGLDPENQTTNALPPLQLWTVGIQLGL